MTKPTATVPPSKFPAHSGSRVWLFTSGSSPIGIALSRQLLAHGDSVVFGVKPSAITGRNSNRPGDFTAFWNEEVLVKEGWKSRARVVGLDASSVGQCQAAVAEAVAVFRKLDVLFCCSSEAIIGTVEELGASSRTSALVRDQFETIYFGQVNMIKAALPSMRAKQSGHVILLTGITGHLGTPGLGMYCASQWAIEGFCDSLAYEVAPFNLKVTIVQPNVEISVLTSPITAAPQLPQYGPDSNPAPLFRDILGGLLDRLDSTTTAAAAETSSESPSLKRLSSDKIECVHPQLSEQTRSQLLTETVHALTAIGGHENPPARHIVGHEAVASVKEKLKTVSEELEDFVEASCAVDIDAEAGTGKRVPKQIQARIARVIRSRYRETLRTRQIPVYRTPDRRIVTGELDRGVRAEILLEAAASVKEQLSLDQGCAGSIPSMIQFRNRSFVHLVVNHDSDKLRSKMTDDQWNSFAALLPSESASDTVALEDFEQVFPMV
ncbi:MAG: hypothetical protein Q9181_005206 [Wetmoreana brouardii]